jgi:hypothetical protein
MDCNDIEKHYPSFKWAVSENWKDKNWLHDSIQYKMEVLKEDYDLPEQNVVDDLFSNYWERRHYLKYDETKGSLNNWIANYVNLYLNHTIRRCSARSKDIQNQRIDPIDQRNQANLVWIDKDNQKDDPDYKPEIVFDSDNPENLLIAKETLGLIHDHFTKPEIDYMMGEIDLCEAAEQVGISCNAFRVRLDRHKLAFKEALVAIDNEK